MTPAPTAMIATSQPAVPAAPTESKTITWTSSTPSPIPTNGSSWPRSRRGGAAVSPGRSGTTAQKAA